MSTKKEQQKKAESKRAGKRARNFATIVYPSKEYLDSIDSEYDGTEGYGSAPENWQEIISDLHIPVMISPLHQDINPDGKMKKPHWHILFMFESMKDWEKQVKPIFDSFGGIGRETVNSARGYARYLCHLDNPEKKQYSPDDVICFGGADYQAVVHLPTDDVKILQDIFLYIRQNQIYSLAEFLDICAINNPEWFSIVAISKAYIVDKYIKSLTWEKESNYVRKIDETKIDYDTGEILK